MMLFPEPRWIVTGISTIVPGDAMPEPVIFAATILREAELTRIPAGYVYTVFPGDLTADAQEPVDNGFELA